MNLHLDIYIIFSNLDRGNHSGLLRHTGNFAKLFPHGNVAIINACISVCIKVCLRPLDMFYVCEI